MRHLFQSIKLSKLRRKTLDWLQKEPISEKRNSFWALVDVSSGLIGNEFALFELLNAWSYFQLSTPL